MTTGFRNLEVWKRSLDLTLAVYRVTEAFPSHEVYGLRAQIRRCAVSIPSNIAEGRGRFSRREYSRHISIARGSLSELETQLEIAQQLGYLPGGHAVPLLKECDELGRMLYTLRARLSQSPDSPAHSE